MIAGALCVGSGGWIVYLGDGSPANAPPIALHAGWKYHPQTIQDLEGIQR